MHDDDEDELLLPEARSRQKKTPRIRNDEHVDCPTRWNGRIVIVIGSFLMITVMSAAGLYLFLNRDRWSFRWTEHDGPSTMKEVTAGFFLGVEGTGHHLWTDLFVETHRYEATVLSYHWPRFPVLGEHVSDWLYSLNSTILLDASAHATMSITGGSYPRGYNGYHILTERFDSFNRDEQQFGVHLDVRTVVMKRHLASTVASAIRRGFQPIEKRPGQHWKGMQLIEKQIRRMSQDQWVMIDHEDFLRRPQEYAHIIAKWFRIGNVSALELGLRKVKVRAPERNIEQESWEKIKAWDARQNVTTGFNMEQAVQDVVGRWEADENSIWNNDCVLVSPENHDFINTGHECW